MALDEILDIPDDPESFRYGKLYMTEHRNGQN